MIIADELIKEEVEKAVRKRIKEMQGDYLSKTFIEKMVKAVISDSVINIFPNIEDYIRQEVNHVIQLKKEQLPKMSKTEILNMVLDYVFENVIRDYE